MKKIALILFVVLKTFAGDPPLTEEEKRILRTGPAEPKQEMTWEEYETKKQETGSKNIADLERIEKAETKQDSIKILMEQMDGYFLKLEQKILHMDKERAEVKNQLQWNDAMTGSIFMLVGSYNFISRISISEEFSGPAPKMYKAGFAVDVVTFATGVYMALPKSKNKSGFGFATMGLIVLNLFAASTLM